METISLKIEEQILEEIDRKLIKNRYSTRTEFIRGAIRDKLSEIEKEAVFKKLEQFKGSLKGKAKMGDEQAGELAFREIARKLNVTLE